MVEKNVFETAVPLSQGLDDRPPPSLIWRSGFATVHAICIFYSPLWKVYGHLATKPFRHQEVNSPLTNNSVIIDVFTHLEVTWRNFLLVSCLSDNQEDINLLDFSVFEFKFFHSFFFLFHSFSVPQWFLYNVKTLETFLLSFPNIHVG